MAIKKHFFHIFLFKRNWSQVRMATRKHCCRSSSWHSAESRDFLISLSSAKRPLSFFPFSTLFNCFSQRNIEQIGTDCDLFTKEFEMKTFSYPKQNIRPGPSLKSLEGVKVEQICIHWRTRVVALGEREMTSCARFFRSWDLGTHPPPPPPLTPPSPAWDLPIGDFARWPRYIFTWQY